ncbi:MAG: Rho termination factor [Nocardioides sp.]
MPAGKKKASPGPSVKDDETYEALRREGNSKEKSARIANAAAAEGSKTVGRRGGKAGSYDDWTVEHLRKRARELDVKGRSSMSKSQLVEALRNH